MNEQPLTQEQFVAAVRAFGNGDGEPEERYDLRERITRQYANLLTRLAAYDARITGMAIDCQNMMQDRDNALTELAIARTALEYYAQTSISARAVQALRELGSTTVPTTRSSDETS